MRIIKQTRLLCSLLALFALLASLAGCAGGSGANTPKVVTDLSLDFESGDFSFTGVDGDVKNYYLRMYPSGTQDPDEQMDALRAARRVRARAEETSYSATIDLSDLQPGDSYDAYLYTYAKDKNGDLVYALSSPVTGVYKATYSTPSGSGVSATIEGSTVTVKLTNDFFTAEYLDKAPTYQITLYSGSAVLDSATLINSDLEIVTTTSTNSSGQEETTTETNGTAAFSVSDPNGSYTVTVRLLSMDSSAYYDSAEGDTVPVTEPVPEGPPAEDAGGEGCQP